MKGLERIEAKQKRLDKWLPRKAKASRIAIAPFDPSEWAKPFDQPARFKAAYGGRSGGKSHHFAERLVRKIHAKPSLRSVCIREIQKSLKFSAKLLIESKIRELGLESCFEILTAEIRHKDGPGLIIFQGMQDHTADSIKSLEGFEIAWVEEAQRLSQRSLDLLIPTIRKEDSEVWFSWNPDQPTDAVDRMFRGDRPPEDSVIVSVSYLDNPFTTSVTIKDAKRARDLDTDSYNHIWLGGYNVKSDLQIFSGKWRVDEFTPLPSWDGPYYGGDWGFSQDPTAAAELWINDNRLYIYRESWEIGLELDDIPDRWMRDLPKCDRFVIRADSSLPATISHVKRHGIPLLTAAEKWPNSVEDGIKFMRNFDQIVIHEQCVHAQEEFRLYQWKTNRAGDPTDVPLDKNNHIPDLCRYALAPLIRNQGRQLAPTPTRPQVRSRSEIRKIF